MLVQKLWDNYDSDLNTIILEIDNKKSISLKVIDSIVDSKTVKILKNTSIDITNTSAPITIDNYMTTDDLRAYIRVLQEICRSML